MRKSLSSPFLLLSLLLSSSSAADIRSSAKKGVPPIRTGVRVVSRGPLQIVGLAARELGGKRKEGQRMHTAQSINRGGGKGREVQCGRSVMNGFLFLMVLSTLVAFFRKGGAGVSNTSTSAVPDAHYAQGLFYSCLALVGNSSVSALRKVLSRVKDVGNAHQVGVAALLQGCGALLYTVISGGFTEGIQRSFWLAAISSSR